MKIYDIFDQENRISVGTLLYFEKEKSFIIELSETLDEWNAPLLFSALIKKGRTTVSRESSLMWVRERVIPSDRQNISAILANHKLKEYDEMKFLEISEGKCSQDSLMIKKTDQLPRYVESRMQRNLTGMFISGDNEIICFFADDTTRRIPLKTLSDVSDVEKIMRNEKLFASGKIGAAGYYITFNDSIDISAITLHSAGVSIPVRKKDFLSFIRHSVLDTTETANILSCSRQNIAYLVKQGQLTPIKENVMGNLYLKDDIIKSRW